MIIAIDPGNAGGIAILSDYNEVYAFRMPDTDGDIIELVNEIMEKYSLADKEKICYIEKVGGFVGFKHRFIICPRCKSSIKVKTGDPGSIMFKFGYGNGFIISTIMTRQIPLEMVTPQKWQKLLSLGTKSGMQKTEWKNKLKAMAQRLYPDQKVTLNTCDALLILEYGRRCAIRSMQGGQPVYYSPIAKHKEKIQPYKGQVEMNLDNLDLPF